MVLLKSDYSEVELKAERKGNSAKKYSKRDFLPVSLLMEVVITVITLSYPRCCFLTSAIEAIVEASRNLLDLLSLLSSSVTAATLNHHLARNC